MAREQLRDSEVISQIKKGTTIPEAAKQHGVTGSVMAAYYYRLEPKADPSLVLDGPPKTLGKKIVAARDVDGLRWERIAFRSGKTVKEVKDIYEEASGLSAEKSYTGKGRNFTGVQRVKPATAPKKKATAKAESTTTAPKRRGRPPGSKNKVQAGTKARTRSQRQAKAGNP